MNDLEKYKILINGMNDTDDFKFKRTLIKQFIKKIYKTYDNKEHNNNEYNEIVYNIDNIIKKNFICDCYPIITNVLQRQCMCPKCNKKSNFIYKINNQFYCLDCKTIKEGGIVTKVYPGGVIHYSS